LAVVVGFLAVVVGLRVVVVLFRTVWASRVVAMVVSDSSSKTYRAVRVFMIMGFI
jgi:hypothetical protein